MSECKLDHSLEDVRKKLEEQQPFLPVELAKQFQSFLEQDLSQQTLNEAFHLLKKYDLASDEERMERNNKIETLFSSRE